jgi:hypothetical protein
MMNIHSAYNFRSIDSFEICRHSHAALDNVIPEQKMSENQVATDAVRDVPQGREADAGEVRTKAVVAALRAALDKVYNEDANQQVLRLRNDYRAWGGESDFTRPSDLQKSK